MSINEKLTEIVEKTWDKGKRFVAYGTAIATCYGIFPGCSRDDRTEYHMLMNQDTTFVEQSDLVTGEKVNYTMISADSVKYVAVGNYREYITVKKKDGSEIAINRSNRHGLSLQITDPTGNWAFYTDKETDKYNYDSDETIAHPPDTDMLRAGWASFKNLKKKIMDYQTSKENSERSKKRKLLP